MAAFGETLRKIREKEGMTQTKLAERVDVNRSMISAIERGSKPASFPLAEKIAEALGCSLDDLAGKKN